MPPHDSEQTWNGSAGDVDGATLLVTGATGVVGAELTRIARARGWEVVGCSRRGGDGVISWDLSEPAPASLRRPWDAIVHAAAKPHWRLPKDVAWAMNTAPVDRVVELASASTHLVLVSTMYATGLRGAARSTDLADYRNTYEWSKAAAELRMMDRLPGHTVVRPPLIIGRRPDGAVARFTGMYTFLGTLTSGQLPAMVADPSAGMELVSTTDVATCCLDAAASPRPDNRALHVMGRGAAAHSLGDVLDAIQDAMNEWREARGLQPLSWPRLISVEQWERFFKPMARKTFSSRQYRTIELLEPFVPYLSIAEAADVSWKVDPMLDCVGRCTTFWMDNNLDRASRDPRSWSPS